MSSLSLPQSLPLLCIKMSFLARSTAILERNLVHSWPQADQLRSQAHAVGCMHSSLAATHKTQKPCLLA